MKAKTGRIGADVARFQFTVKKILILDGIENGGFLTRCAQSTVGDKDPLSS